jgi:hypothetical protein
MLDILGIRFSKYPQHANTAADVDMVAQEKEASA